METNKSENKLNEPIPRPFAQTFFHGTKADLKIGDFIEIGINSNYGQNKKAKYIYLTATLDAAAINVRRPKPAPRKGKSARVRAAARGVCARAGRGGQERNRDVRAFHDWRRRRAGARVGSLRGGPRTSDRAVARGTQRHA